MDKYVWWSRLLRNMYVDPDLFSLMNLWNRYSYKLIMCQEPDLNWWHEDFQSSALPAELSRPFVTHHPHFKRLLEYMSTKKKRRKKITKFDTSPGISWIFQNKTLYVSVGVMICIVNQSNEMRIPCSKIRCSFVHLSYRNQILRLSYILHIPTLVLW